MNKIFHKIYMDKNGNPDPLPPLQDAMQYQYKVKQTNTIDGWKVLPYDMNAEIFYPLHQDNVGTTPIVEDMAASELAILPCWVNFVTQRKLFQITLLLLGASSAGVKLPKRSMLPVLVKIQLMILMKAGLHN